MSSRDRMKFEERSEEAAPPAAPVAVVVAPVAVVVASIGPQSPVQEPPVAFDRWFKVRSKELGFKPHWAAGMQSYTNTNVPRPMAEWDRIFSSY